MLNNSARLFYLDDIPTPYRVGVFRRVAELWEGEFRVAFCAEAEPGRSFEIDLAGLDTRVLRGFQWRPLGQTNPFSFKWNPGVVAELEAFKPDIVILSGYAHPTMLRAALWCLANRIPYAVACETSARSTAIKGPRWQLRQSVAGWMIRNMAFGLPVGNEAASYLRMFGTDAQMYAFPNTPDTGPFEAAAARFEAGEASEEVRRRYGLSSEAPLFVFVGRLISAKRSLDAIAAIRNLPKEIPACLLIVGDGPQAEVARELALDDPRIAFAGWVNDQSKLAAIFAEASVLILPSAHEPWGAVVNEAMAARTSIIATDRVGAAVELVSDGQEGFLVSVGDVSAITEAIATLAGDSALRSQMGANAQIRAVACGAEFAACNLIAGACAALCSKTN